LPARKPKKPNHRLRAARLARGWSEKYVADKVGTDRFTVGRWELGVQVPGPFYRPMLCELFQMDTFALGIVEEDEKNEISRVADAPRSVIWSVPFIRNPHCTGFDQLVVELRKRLMAEHGGISLLAISGLGGIGKTQLALEYAHRYNKKYEAVLWVPADSPEHLSAALDQHARRLDVPEARKRQPNPDYLVNEVYHWLREHNNWLLILDNVEENVELDFLSSIRSRGHVLLTTRVLSVADRGEHLVMEKMPVEVGALLLLRVVHDSSASLETFSVGEREEAMALARILEGLPLALVQAGAYIREKGRSLTEYRRAYQRYRKIFLRWRSTHDKAFTDYSESVATTWLISFRRVRQQSTAALAILCLCAYLHPDAIPSDIILKATYEEESVLKPLAKDDMQLDHACGILINYALIRRNIIDGMLSLHRLVQAVLKDRMSEQEQHNWAERTVRAVEAAWSNAPEADTERYLPHAYSCATLITDLKINSEEAASLLERAADLADARGWYTKAASLYRRAHDACARLLGEDDPHVVRLNMDVAHTLMEQWQYPLATSLYQRAYLDCVRLFGPNHPVTIACLNDLALAQLKQGSVGPALKTISQVYDVLDQAPDQQPEESAKVIQIFGEIEQLAGNEGRAEECFRMALDIRLQAFGHRHTKVAQTLLLLGDLYAQHDQPPERLEQAERSFREALAIFRGTLGKDHPETAYGMLRLGMLFLQRGNAKEAIRYCEQAVAVFERKLGLAHYSTGQGMYCLAMVLSEQKQYVKAEQYFRKAKDILMLAGGPETALYLQLLSEYAELLRAMGREDEARQYEDYVETTQRRLAARGGPVLSFSLPSLNEEGLPGSLWIVPRPDWDVTENT
jgi:tetratricopeptide (TPR) repeat protein/transcriptional regulator with XRE-family HTH domain